MATIDLGKIKQVWRGTYNNGTAYIVDDLVAYTDTVGGLQNTSTYIAVANTTGNAPASGGSIHASWNLVAQGVPDRLPSQSGQAGKFLTTDGSSVSFGTVESDWNKFAIFELHDTGGNFRCFPAVMGVGGTGGRSNFQLSYNRMMDHGNIINTSQSNYFTVNETGTYTLDSQFVNHNPQHYRMPYLYNRTDSKSAEAYTSTRALNTNVNLTMIGYHDNESGHLSVGEQYYLETGHEYDFRWSCDGNMNTMSTGTNYLLSNYTLGGVTQYNVVLRFRLNKVATPS